MIVRLEQPHSTDANTAKRHIGNTISAVMWAEKDPQEDTEFKEFTEMFINSKEGKVGKCAGKSVKEMYLAPLERSPTLLWFLA